MKPQGASRTIASMVEPLGPLMLLAAWLGLWELLVRSGAVGSIFFPPPSTIAGSVVNLFASGAAVTHAAITMERTLAGFAIGASAGLILGFAMGAWPRLHALLDPLVALVHPIPKIAVLPLILIVFGIDEASKIALGAVVAFFPMLINTIAAVRHISPTYFEVARSYGASPTRVFTRVMVPGSLPLVLTGAKLSLNVALMMVIAAELLVAQRGLGQMLWFSWQTMRIADVYAWLFVTGSLGVVLNWMLAGLAVWAMPWRDDAGRVVG
jgi:ABC-type nitrate/sulfonate/bicarbonate transport system permease component